MQKRFLTLAGLALLGLALMPTRGYATALPITDGGILTIENLTGTLVGVTLTPNFCINWAGLGACSTTPVNMGVSGTSNLFAAPSTGTIGDVLNGASETTPFETVLGAGALAGQTIDFSLINLVVNGPTAQGNCGSNAAFNSCTPANSPFTFTMDATGTQLTVTGAALLSAYTGTSATGTTPYVVLFSTQDSGTFTGSGACAGEAANITDALSCSAAGGTITSSWSATESPYKATPEPGTIPLLGMGLIGLAWCSRRFRRA